MKKQLALLWTPLVLALAMALPASTTAATGVTFSIVSQHCSGSSGVYFRVKVQSSGSSTANKLTVKSKSQYKSGTKWHTYYQFALDQNSFTPDGHAHQADYSYTHDGMPQYEWRIVSTLKAYHGSTVLASKTFKSHAC